MISESFCLEWIWSVSPVVKIISPSVGEPCQPSCASLPYSQRKTVCLFFSLINCNKLFVLFTTWHWGPCVFLSCYLFNDCLRISCLFIDLQSLWLWPHLTPSKFKLIQKVASSRRDSIIPLYLRRQQLHCATVCRRSVASKPATFMSVASLNDLKSKILGGVCCLVSKAQSWDTRSSCLCAFNSTQTLTNRQQGGSMYSEVKVVV